MPIHNLASSPVWQRTYQSVSQEGASQERADSEGFDPSSPGASQEQADSEGFDGPGLDNEVSILPLFPLQVIIP